MKTSVIIPTHKRASMLKRCIESVLKNKLCEIIVISDCKDKQTDELMKIYLKNKNIHYYKHKKQGPGSSRNVGIEKSKGKYLAFLDDDCEVKTDWIKTIENCFEKYQTDIISFNMTSIKQKTIPLFLNYTETNKEKHLVLVTTTIYKKKLLKKIRFNETKKFYMVEDLDFNYKCIKKGLKIKKVNYFIYHNYRTDLKGFMKQQYNYGKGRYNVMKYIDDYPVKKDKTYHLRLVLTPIADPLIRTNIALKNKRKDFILFFFLGIIQQICYWMGFFKEMISK